MLHFYFLNFRGAYTHDKYASIPNDLTLDLLNIGKKVYLDFKNMQFKNDWIHNNNNIVKYNETYYTCP